MNYNNIYQRLINRAKERLAPPIYEQHHIIPKCMGGNDSEQNLVKLTPEEHYVAHQLLVKMYPEDKSLVFAANMMIPKRPNNKMYGWLKRKLKKTASLSFRGRNNSQYGTRWISNITLKISKKIKITSDVPAGWVIGRNKWNSRELRKKSLPKMLINDGKKHRYIEKTALIPKGWSVGRTDLYKKNLGKIMSKVKTGVKRPTSFCLNQSIVRTGRIRVYHPGLNKTKFIPESEVKTYLCNGYERYKSRHNKS